MIGYLSGKCVSKNRDGRQCVVLCDRVGYEVTVPGALLDHVQIDTDLQLFIHTHVREDVLTLFGFLTEHDKALFRLLLSASGLGPKTALSLVEHHGALRLVSLITEKDVNELSEAPGVGKKLAQRIILELSAKIEKWAFLQDLKPSEQVRRSSETAPAPTSLKTDLSSALTHLGYPPHQIRNVLERLLSEEENEKLGFETCLKSALKELSGRGLPGGEIHG